MELSNSFFDAFISYGRADSKAFATYLTARLKAIGLNIWFDQEDIPLAVDFQEQINNGIEKTHNFIFVIAPHSVNSPYCLKEIELAVKLNKRIMPILHVENISRDTWQSRNPTGTDAEWQAYQAAGKHTVFQNMHPVISKINWINFRENVDNFEDSLDGLVNAIRKHQQYVHQHTEILGRALEWSRNQKREQYLLLEERKRQAESWLKQRFIHEQPPCLPTDLHAEFICASIRYAQGSMSRACLCYVQSLAEHQEDQERERDKIQRIRRSLLRACVTVADNRVEGQTQKEFDARRRQKVDFADNFIYFVTEESLQNSYCQQQLNHAYAQNKRIIFLILEPVDNEHYPYFVDQLHLIDFTDNVKTKKFQGSLDSLLKLIDHDSYYHERHKYLLAKALRWQEQRKIESILLRGHILQAYEDLLKIANQRQYQQFTTLQREYLEESSRRATNTEIEVFLAYAAEDLDFAMKLNETLEFQGKSTFFAYKHVDLSAESYPVIDQGIINASNFLVIISPDSLNSTFCMEQVQRANKLSKRILGILYRPADPQRVNVVCAEDQCLDFTRGSFDFYTDFSQLIRLLDTDKAYVQTHTKWLQRTEEWLQEHKTRDLLLRGNELAIAQYWLKEAEETHKRPKPTAQQQDFIHASFVESQRNILRQKLLFAAVSVGFVVSTVLGAIASHKSYRAAVSELRAVINTSNVLFSANNELDAFVEAMRAWRKSRAMTLNRQDDYLVEEIHQAISQAVYQLRESNRLSDHRAAVLAMDYNADGSLLVSGSADKTIKIWSGDGGLVATLGQVGPINKGHTEEVNTVVFSPDDQLIVSGSTDKSMKLWRRDREGNYQFAMTIHGCFDNRSCDRHTDGINDIVFSPDGQWFASASEDGSIKLWSLQGDYLGTVGAADPDSQHQAAVNDVVFSPKGDRLISASDDKTIKIWQKDPTTGAFTLQTTIAGCDTGSICDGHKDNVKGVAISPDGKLIVSASDDKTVKMWNSDGTLRHTLVGHLDEVEAVAIDNIAGQGKMIASVSRDKTIRLWDFNGSLISTLPGHKARIYDVVFKPNQMAIASASRDKTIKLWQLDNQIITRFYGHTDRVYDVIFSPDNQLIASAGRDETIKLWNRQGKLLQNFPNNPDSTDKHTAAIEKIAFSPDGKLLASASWDHTVKLWSITGQLQKTITGHTAEVFGVAFSPDGQILATLGGDRTLRLWDLQGNPLQKIDLQGGHVYDLHFSQDGELLLIAIDDAVQTLERNPSGARTYRLGRKIGNCQILDANCHAHGDDIEEVSINADKTLIATASRDSTVKVWDREGHNLYTLWGHDGELEGVSFSADGKKLVSASRDGTLVIWENLPDIHRIQQELADHGGVINYGDFKPTIQADLFGRDGDGTVQSKVLRGHQAEVYTGSFSADGQTLVSASADQTVILWDLQLALNINSLIRYGCDWTKNYVRNADLQRNPSLDKKFCEHLPTD